jgi:hypothetical protein
MIVTDPLWGAIQRILIDASEPGTAPLSIAHEFALERLAHVAQHYAQRRPRACSFLHKGMRFRLHKFDGWLIVTTQDGEPVAGPVRIRGGKA